jgi:hypothetical protein
MSRRDGQADEKKDSENSYEFAADCQAFLGDPG